MVYVVEPVKWRTTHLHMLIGRDVWCTPFDGKTLHDPGFRRITDVLVDRVELDHGVWFTGYRLCCADGVTPRRTTLGPFEMFRVRTDPALL